MLKKACYILLASVCVSLTATANGSYVSATEGEETDTVHRAYVRKDAETLKRERVKIAAGGAKLADKLAEGGVDFNPFSEDFIASRHSPYESSMRVPDSTKLSRFRRLPVKRCFFVGAYTGLNAYVHTSSLSHAFSSRTLGVMAGYQFNGLHALRLTANVARHTGTDYVQSLRTIQVGLDYMFNLSNYLWGDNPKRVIELKPTIGLGVLHSTIGEGNSVSPTGRFGLNIAYKINSNSELFVEPFIMQGQDVMDQIESPRRYDVQYGFLGGVRLDLDGESELRGMRMPSFNPNIFVDISTGAQWYGMSGMGDTFKRTTGLNTQIAVGKWLSPILGLRFGLSYADFYWQGKSEDGIVIGGEPEPQPDVYSHGASASGRFELLARPFNFIRRWRELSHCFDFEISGGMEAGWYSKPNVPDYGNLEAFNLGYTVAANFLFKVAPHAWIFIEPRAQFVNFNVALSEFAKEQSYTDKIYNVNAGIRLQRPTRKQRDEIYYEDPVRCFELGFGGGGLKQMGGDNDDQIRYPFCPMATAYGMYHFDYHHSVMLQADYMRLNRELNPFVNTTNNLVQANFLYATNLTTLIAKPNYLRPSFNVYGLIGPAVVANVKSSAEVDSYLPKGYTIDSDALASRSGKMAAGLSTGVLIKYDYGKRWGLFVEPEASFFFGAKKCIGTERNTAVVLKLLAGLKYRF